MPKRKIVNETSSGDTRDRLTSKLGDRLLNALTQPEIARLIDALFRALSPEL